MKGGLDMGDEPQINLKRVARLAREAMQQDEELAEDFREGRDMLEALSRIKRLPVLGVREIRGLNENEFDGQTALTDAKAGMEAARMRRERRLGPRRK